MQPGCGCPINARGCDSGVTCRCLVVFLVLAASPPWLPALQAKESSRAHRLLQPGSWQDEGLCGTVYFLETRSCNALRSYAAITAVKQTDTRTGARAAPIRVPLLLVVGAKLSALGCGLLRLNFFWGLEVCTAFSTLRSLHEKSHHD